MLQGLEFHFSVIITPPLITTLQSKQVKNKSQKKLREYWQELRRPPGNHLATSGTPRHTQSTNLSDASNLAILGQGESVAFCFCGASLTRRACYKVSLECLSVLWFLWVHDSEWNYFWGEIIFSLSPFELFISSGCCSPYCDLIKNIKKVGKKRINKNTREIYSNIYPRDIQMSSGDLRNKTDAVNEWKN